MPFHKYILPIGNVNNGGCICNFLFDVYNFIIPSLILPIDAQNFEFPVRLFRIAGLPAVCFWTVLFRVKFLKTFIFFLLLFNVFFVDNAAALPRVNLPNFASNNPCFISSSDIFILSNSGTDCDKNTYFAIAANTANNTTPLPIDNRGTISCLFTKLKISNFLLFLI